MVFLAAIVWIVFAAPSKPVSMKHSTMRVQAHLTPAGTWSSPPVPGRVGDIDATIHFKRETHTFWSSVEYSIFIMSASANGVPMQTAQVLAAWNQRLDAGDTRWASSEGDSLSIAEQKAVLAALAAREAARAAAIAPGAATRRSLGDPLFIATPPYMRWVAHANWVIPVSLILLSLVLAVGRAGRRAAIRARFVRLKSGVCPECGYLRSGIADDAVCPECGEDPVEALDAAVRERQRLMGAKLPASPQG
ncbi:MAG: hypothetical protein HEQ23_04505 [Tepidisphaera sp.]